MTPAQDRAARHTECDQVLVEQTRGSVVELHWAVTPPYFCFPLSTEALFARSVAVEVGGFRAAAPGPEDLLLLLAVNGTKDLWLRLETVCLVARVLRLHPALDWAAVRERARAVHSQRMLALALRLASELLEVPLPQEARGLASGGASLDRLVEATKGRLLAGEPVVPGAVAGLLFRLQARERWIDRARHGLLRALLPTTADCAALPLPAPLWPAAVLVRPLRLLARAPRRGF